MPEEIRAKRFTLYSDISQLISTAIENTITVKRDQEHASVQEQTGKEAARTGLIPAVGLLQKIRNYVDQGNVEKASRAERQDPGCGIFFKSEEQEVIHIRPLR